MRVHVLLRMRNGAPETLQATEVIAGLPIRHRASPSGKAAPAAGRRRLGRKLKRGAQRVYATCMQARYELKVLLGHDQAVAER
jgi:hypothetical protein